MKQEFCTYEQASALKELKFNEECIAFYKDGKHNEDIVKAIDQHWGSSLTGIENTNCIIDDIILAPLKTQVFKFFRDKYGLYHYITTHDSTDFEWYIYDKDQNDWEDDTMQNTYEEAESACIDKLIELVKNIK